MNRSTSKAAETEALATVPSSSLATIQAVIQSIPQAQTDPTERMAAFILNAPPEEWDALWAKLPNLKDNVGRSFRLHDIRVADSDFEGPLGVYLICDVTWKDTGENALLSASSQISMVQMLALYRDKKLPADLQIVEKDKPTRAGFRPIHLHYLNREQIPAGDPTAVVSEQ